MIQSIDRAMLVIQTLAHAQKEKWLVAELAEETGLPISTVYRLTQSLTEHGLVKQIQDTKQFTLGCKWMELGLKMYDKLDVRNISRPILETLALEVEETVYLNIPNDNDSIIIDRIESPRTVKIIDSIGERIPLHIGAANKTILANFSLGATERLLEQLVLDSQEREDFKKELLEVKQKGYAVSYGEKTKGTIAVGSPILGFDGRIIGAISIEVLAYNLTDNRMDFFIEKVYEASNKISSGLGY